MEGTKEEVSGLATEALRSVREHVRVTWDVLTRSHKHLLDAARDIKVEHAPDACWPVYISPKEDCERVKKQLRDVLSSEELGQLDIRILPAEVEAIEEHGLLYLPKPYIVPGGRFNELYGWDCYFIQMGLLRDGELEMAQNLVDLLIYEVSYYGMVLNANRTYYLTRSQPPLLTPMVLAMFERTKDRAWMEAALTPAETYYYFWKVPPHLNQATGLSRYFDMGEGPAPEVIVSERDESGRTHYDKIREFYRSHHVPDYDVALYYDKKGDRLTDLFYKGDRSMRESGFDPTNRFGPFSADIIHYAPVCLNVFLYRMEQDLARMHELLGHGETARCWVVRAEERAQLIQKFLWDEEHGLYLDYNFQTGERRYYPYVTTFLPLWAGIATKEQARRLVENLALFESSGGLRTSTVVTGNQWDAPFGWAPMQWTTIEGLRRYGYDREAERIAGKFVSLLVDDFQRSGTLLEKYNVDRCSGEVSREIEYGYRSNEIGFGWTNGVLAELLDCGVVSAEAITRYRLKGCG